MQFSGTGTEMVLVPPGTGMWHTSTELRCLHGLNGSCFPGSLSTEGQCRVGQDYGPWVAVTTSLEDFTPGVNMTKVAPSSDKSLDGTWFVGQKSLLLPGVTFRTS